MSIAKTSEQVFIETRGIDILKLKLTENRHITPYFTENDKTPNTDGRFEFIQDHTAKKEFVVQIKSTTHVEFKTDGKHAGKYIYELDTAILDYVKSKITESPAFIFVIDITTQKIFYHYLSDDYLMGLNFEGKENVQIDFSENNILNNIVSFENELECIILQRNTKFPEISPSETIEIQDALDWLNDSIKEIPVIKKVIFPDLWRFGISTSYEQKKDFKNLHTFSIFPQCKGTNELEIQRYNPNKLDYYQTKFQIGQKINPKGYTKEILQKIIDDYFNKLPFNMEIYPTVILEELAFNYLDNLSSGIKEFEHKDFTNRFYKDEISLDEFILLWNQEATYFEHLLYSSTLSSVELQAKERILYQRNRFFNASLDFPLIIKALNLEENYHNTMPESDVHHTFWELSDLGDCLSRLAVKELSARGYTTIKRVWNAFYSKRGGFRSEYDKQLISKTRTWLNNLPELYLETLKKFGASNLFEIKDEYLYKFEEYEFNGTNFTTLFTAKKPSNDTLLLTESNNIDRATIINKGYLSTSDCPIWDFSTKNDIYFMGVNLLLKQGICNHFNLTKSSILEPFSSKELDLIL